MKRKSGGFTLIEVVVVIAVIAILAAILAPSIVKNVDDAKISRAEAEVKVIAASMTSFYKDLGQWPSGVPAGTVDILTSASGNTPTDNAGSWSGGGITIETLEAHLIDNDDGTGTAIYPTTGKQHWKGPYAIEFSSDPWGNKYYVNIGDTVNNPTYPIWVVSAGPDGALDTDPSDGTNALGGDDIGFRIK